MADHRQTEVCSVCGSGSPHDIRPPLSPASSFVVKNTFIEFPDEAELQQLVIKRRRSASVPASPCRRTAAGSCNETRGCREDHCQDDVRDSGSPRNVQPEPPASGFSVENSSNEFPDQEPQQPALSHERSSSVPPPLSTAVANEAQETAPSSVPSVRLPARVVMLEKVAGVVAAAISAVARCAGRDVTVQTHQDRRGWSIVIRIPDWMKEPLWREGLLSLAKAAVLTAAKQSDSIHVLGYLASPFREKSNGFSCVLGLMFDEAEACWDVYKYGLCKRGPSCRWEHDIACKRLYVVVRRGVVLPEEAHEAVC